MLEQVEKQTGRRPKELDGPEFPQLLSHVWSAFLSLNNSRTMATHTANPITFEAIKAFCDLTHTFLSPRDVETIQILDQTYRSVMNRDG